MRKIPALLARLNTQLADKLGFWRIDVIWYMARAVNLDKLAAQLDAAGVPGSAAQVRDTAARWRQCARDRIPARARPAWRQATGCTTMSDPVTNLREAATLMREQHGPEHPRHAFWSALADWLDAVTEQAGQQGHSFHILSPGPLRVARAYLGRGDG